MGSVSTAKVAIPCHVEWARHLRKAGRRLFWKLHRVRSKRDIRKRLRDGE